MYYSWLAIGLFIAISLIQKVIPQDLPVAPAPWNLDVSEGYVFVTPPLLSISQLPEGFADPNEAKALSSNGTLIPDIGTILIARYVSTPVGPYDEMIYIPGKWKYETGDLGFRITRIYVSTNESVINGRRNWNIPKHIAAFDCQTSPLGEMTLSVSSSSSEGKPFFSAKFLPTTLPIPIEVNTTLVGDYLNLIQPPLPAGMSPAEISTDTWKSFLLNAKTDTVAASLIIGNLTGGKIGDGVGYPNIQPLFPVGAKLSGKLIFPVSEIIEV
ncbi:hypothetical protein K435DRAFT_861300 [Dendrothele bispora CBS 962.96]|uniref:Acetoacetate decarboxylase n=1 Tax=Dendrothele bispora (strain CBS 962.96) TaxID=1314807 RepID=A0A4S8LW28_DENBC|nr:hypothetical protein K435DRAFT_861300 [Dendrothele bispora CBS 962.96]